MKKDLLRWGMAVLASALFFSHALTGTAATVSWVGGSGDWNTAANWSTGALPGANDDVVISPAATITITHSAGTHVVHSILSGEAFVLSGGVLAVTTTFLASNTITLSGGTLQTATVTTTNGASLIVNGSATLDGVTVNGMLDVGSSYNGTSLTVLDGLVLNGTALVGNPSNNWWGRLNFSGTQTLGGNGTVVFGSSGSVGGTYNGLQVTSGGTILTLGSGMTVSGQYGVVGYNYSVGGPANVAIINQGTISANVSGGYIWVVGQPVSNQGVLAMSNGGQLVVQGLVGDMGQVAQVAGGTLSLSGTYTNNLAINLTTNAVLNLSGNWVNTGSLNLTNATLNLSGTWTNNGAINAVNSTVNFGGTFTLANLGQFNRVGGMANLTGVLNNTNTVLGLNAFGGSWGLNGGTVLGGTVTGSNGASLIVNGSGTLDGVTVNGMLDVGSSYNGTSLTVLDGMVLNGTALVGNPSNNWWGRLNFSGTQTLGGNGTVVFGSSGSVGGTYNGLQVTSGGTILTLGSGMTVSGQYGVVGYNYSVGGPANVAIINQGTISANVSGGYIWVVGQPVSNQGVLAMSNGGQLVVQGLVGDMGQVAQVAGGTLSLSGTYTNNLAINLTTNAVLNLSGNWVNTGSLNLTNATLNLSGTWTNNGAINAVNSTVNFGGTFTLANLGQFNRVGGMANLTGVLNNTNTVLGLNAFGGSWGLNGGTVLGGTVTGSNGASLIVNGSGTLDGVTVNGMLDVGSSYNGTSLTVLDGLVLNGTALVGNPSNNWWGRLNFSGTQTLGGNGTVVFGSSGDVGGTYNGLQVTSGGTILTLGSGMTVSGQYGVVGYNYSVGGPANVAIINQGTISANVSGGYIWVVGQPVSNQGVLAMSNGGQLVVQGLVGDMGQVAQVAGGTLSLSGTYTNNLAINLTTNAVLNLSGNWVNTGSLNLTNATLNLSGTWTNNGAINAVNSTVNFGGTFTLANLGQFNRVGGMANLTGVLNNTNTVLGLNAFGGSWGLNGGTVLGGTVTGSNGASLIVNGSGTLDGVTVNGMLDVGSSYNGTSLTVLDGLVLNGTALVGNPSNNWWGRLNFSGTQTLGGNGTVVFGSSGDVGGTYNGLQVTSGGTILTLGSGMTVSGQYGVVGYNYSVGGPANVAIINQGTISANVSGGYIWVVGQPVSNQGIISCIASGASVEISAQPFTNTGTLSATLGTLNLSGSNNLASGAIDVGISGLSSYGQVNIAGNAVLAGALNVSLNNGYIPALNNSFAIVTCGSGSGTFSSVNVPGGTSVNYSNAGVFLTVTGAVPAPPFITQRPTNYLATLGSTAMFSVAATGALPLAYQWQFNGTNLTNNAQITGSQSNVLALMSVSTANAGIYQVVVTNVYGTTKAFATLSVPQVLPIITWTNPSAITYGTALSASQLNATSSVSGIFTYTPAAGTVLNAGTNTLTVLFTPTDTVDYTNATASVSLVVWPAALTVTANNASRVYGQPNPVFTGTLIGLQNSDNITATNATTATLISPVGTYSIIPALVDPNGRLVNYTVTFNDGTLTITQAVPVIIWTNPAAFVVGVALDTNQLNASAMNGAANVSGTFAYSPAAGTILPVGTNTLSVVFTPTDAVDYAGASGSVSLVVSPASSGQFNVLATFNGANGAASTGLTLGNDGNFYGTTYGGGTNGDGTVFRVTTNGVLTSLMSFNGANGAIPDGRVTLGPDGNFYGTTYAGGTNGTGDGTVFRVTTNGLLTTLVSFAGTNGQGPTGPLTLGADGNFYGTTYAGGTNGTGDGTVFRVTTNGVLTSLVSFAGTNGASPNQGGVTLGNDGNFYGVTHGGGTNGNGTIYRVTTNGILTSLLSFTGANGATPDGGLNLGRDGSFYGVATWGGGSGYGTVFRVTTNGVLTTLVSFTGNNGALPEFLSLGNDGKFYGVTDGGVSSDVYGTVFQVTTNGLLRTLVSFAGTNGANPDVPLTLGNDGNFYGTTGHGGSNNDGVFFELLGPVGMSAQPVSQTVAAGSNAVFTVTAIGGSPFAYQWLFNGTNLSGAINSSLAITGVSTANQGNYQVIVSNFYGSVTSSIAVLTIQATGPTTPALTWTNPPAITYGTALSASQLNATSSVSGAFAYTPAAGTVLNAGTNTLTALFTPTDTVDYTNATASVSLVVWPAALTVTANNTSRSYGQANPVFTDTLTGLQNGDNITATNATTATTSSPVGTFSIIPALVDPNGRLVNYTVTTTDGTLTINQATPAITNAPTASTITYGQTLASSTLGGGMASVPGRFAFTVPTTAPAAGTAMQSVTFTPTDATDYNSVTTNVSVTINQATPTITNAPAASAITYGQTLASSTLSGGTASVPGRFDFTVPTTAPAAGTAMQSVTFTPTDATDYNSVLLSVNVTVSNGTNLVTWTTPSAITYGTALGTNQLNATASVPGSFAYAPPAGVVLDAGTNALTAVFTPSNTVAYGSVTSSVSLLVSPAALAVAANNASRSYGQTNPAFSGTITGIQNGDDISAYYSTPANPGSPVGTYLIIPALVDPDGSLDNYIVTYHNGTLTVGKAAPIITWPVPGAIGYGTALGGAQLNATSNVPGTLAYTPAAGAVLNAGTNTLTVVFSPTNTTDYSSVTSSVSLVVSPAALTVTANSLYQPYTGTAFAGGNGVTYAGFVNGDTAAALGGTLSYGGTSQGAVAVGNYSIVPSGLTAANYTISYVNGTLHLGLPPQITTQPTNQIVPLGGTAQFSVSATGTGLLTYQWWFNQTNLLTAATNATLTLTNITLAQDGGYSVVVGNNFGSVTSTSALLASDSLPAISAFTYFFSGTNSGTGSRTVTLNATVNPDGLPTTVVFQYGLTTSYAAATAPISLPGLLTGTNVSTSVDSIVPGVVYHVQVVATNSLGHVSTPDQSFYTPGIYPPGETNADGVVDQNELNAVLANYWPNSPWVAMTNTAGLGSLTVQFGLTNASNWNFSVLVSTNLTDWQYLGPATPLYQFADPQATNRPIRYYRLRWP